MMKKVLAMLLAALTLVWAFGAFAETTEATPGTVEHWDPETRTASVRPAAAGKFGGKRAGMPLLRDVPVFSPAGAAWGIQPGDECLVVFADGCIDGWFETGSDALPPSNRMHDLSDGFAFVGFHSKRGAL